MTDILSSVEECVDRAIARVGKNLVLMAPLGLGKPVQLVNAFYRRAEADPDISLHIYTALCLETPPMAPASRRAWPARSWIACSVTTRSWPSSSPCATMPCRPISR